MNGIDLVTMSDGGALSTVPGVSGDVATVLLRNNWDPGVLRPFHMDAPNQAIPGRSYITMNKGAGGILLPEPKTMVHNTNATLHYNDWKEIDREVATAQKPITRLQSDLRAKNLVRTINGGMARTTLVGQTVSDTGPASMSMDGRTKGQSDRPEFGTNGIPLVIVHRDFNLGAREIASSRQFGDSIDLTEASQASERVAETVEKLITGEASFTYAGLSVYGYTSHPHRLTMSLTDPTDGGWTAATLVNEVLAMRQLSEDEFYAGPWMCYLGRGWSQYLDQDYVPEGATAASSTLRDRLRRIEGIDDVQVATYLPSTDVVLVPMVRKNVELVVAMETITLQWPSNGGMDLNFKVMCIIVPRLRSDINQRMGLVHGSVA